MILIGAGHTHKSPGACNNVGFCENSVASDWIDTIYYLILPHIPTIVIPNGSLKQKVNFCNAQPDAKIAFELHFNSNVSARGSETLYYPGSASGLLLASKIQTEFSSNKIFQPNRGVKEGYHHSSTHAQRKLLYFLAKTKMTSVIIEPAFISQKEYIEEHKYEGCRAIADGIIKFYSKNYGGLHNPKVS